MTIFSLCASRYLPPAFIETNDFFSTLTIDNTAAKNTRMGRLRDIDERKACATTLIYRTATTIALIKILRKSGRCQGHALSHKQRYAGLYADSATQEICFCTTTIEAHGLALLALIEGCLQSGGVGCCLTLPVHLLQIKVRI